MKDYTYNRSSTPDSSCENKKCLQEDGAPGVAPIQLSESALDALRESVKVFYTEKRFRHALAVEDEVIRLGKVFLPHRVNALRAAALLHDVTKKFDLEKQLQCCSEFSIILGSSFSPETIHAVTGAVVAGQEFPQYTDNEILGGIRWHTTGRWGMTVFEAIVFLADYIEPTRTHEACVSLRNTLYSRLKEASTPLEKERAFNGAVLQALDNTITYLVSKKSVIEEDTVAARNYYLTEKEL